MRTTTNWVTLITGLVMTCAPAGAQEQFWYVPHVDDAKTPVEVQLESPELAMPGFGLGSTKAQIIKRIEFSLDHKWLPQNQVDQLCNDLKRISDKEQSLRDTEGKLSYDNRALIAKQLLDLNQKFEEQVLVREQSNPGIEGLQAREAMMIQRVNLALSQGKVTGRQAAEMKGEIRAVMANMPDKDLTDEQSREIASSLSKINNSLDKDFRNPSMASRVLPFSR